MENRLKVFKIIMVVIFILLLLRAGQLQLVEGKYYYQLSEGNRISLRPINAPRGKMFDRNGEISVTNTLSYNIYLLPNEIPPELTREDIVNRLASYTGYEREVLRENYERSLKSGGRSSSGLLLKRNISRENMVILEENSDDLPGILVEESSIRDYVFREIGAHNFGYTGEISLSELESVTDRGYNYNGRDMIGKSGLEREYELHLRGIAGVEQIEVNSAGEKVKTLGVKSPVPGNNLHLNLDMELQTVSHRLLQENLQDLKEKAREDDELSQPTGGVVIVMEPGSGRILSLVSLPSFDSNHFAGGISEKKYVELSDDPENPLWNRPVRAVLPPGSVFKLITGVAAIEELGINEDTMFEDENGEFKISGWDRPFRNWLDEGEGELSFSRAIARSNNIVFYELGYRLYRDFGGEVLTSYADKFGLGKKTGVDLPGERPGLAPTPEWKREHKGEGWYPGDSVNLSIGQGDLLTTPMQLIQIINVIANEGKIYRPFLVDEIVDSRGNVVKEFSPEVSGRTGISDRTFSIMEEGMLEATRSSYGTARSAFQDFPVKVAGKTGTAQTSSVGTNHGWFAGYAPADEPEVSILVFLENGNSSSYALPVASGILQEYFGFEREDVSDGEGNKE
ncbi:MAG: penicillin-binding protein 2 [Halanaerobiales bacterium]